MMDRDQYDRLVEAIYTAILDPNLWSSTVTDLEETLKPIAKHVQLETFFTEETNVVEEDFYQTRPIKYDSLLKLNRGFYSNQAVSINHFPGHPENPLPSNIDLSLYCSLHYHLKKAQEIYARLNDITLRLAANESAINNLRIGVIVLRQNGCVTFTNGYARNILEVENDTPKYGSWIKSVIGYNMTPLNRAICQAFEHQQKSTIKLTLTLQARLSVTVIPLISENLPVDKDQIFVTLFIIDLDDNRIGNVDYLASRWKLSPSEARFTFCILKGKTISEIADQMELTKNTARWYSKQIMQKLNVNRQSDLIIKLMKDLNTHIPVR